MIWFLSALLALLLLGGTALAAGSGRKIDLVTDAAGLLTDSQRAFLESRAEKLSEQYECDVAIVTVDSLDGYAAADYNEAVYRQYGLGYLYSDDYDGDVVDGETGEVLVDRGRPRLCAERGLPFRRRQQDRRRGRELSHGGTTDLSLRSHGHRHRARRMAGQSGDGRQNGALWERSGAAPPDLAARGPRARSLAGGTGR
jgi:hypothetical protein